MREENNIGQKVEKALSSLDGIQRATPGPFFFTRVQARVQRQTGSGWDQAISFITRPAVALVGLCIILLLNAAAFWLQPGSSIAAGASPGESGYVEDYSAVASNFFYDENPEP